ncbi:hypothetical protein [Rhizobium sp. WW_1]|uniref:hypothetical protein n=1 Tax=Rhizobium sp. WW_1 TaxID=1907375 RepID=UPI000645D2D7|nr:hypothetical protein [Rhizobium sp. WW_1]RKD61564.1 hypothetical protein BJ928_107165 [Rhizobium sp. WW_1]
MSNTVQIADVVAMREQTALVEHYRNRNLILAQALADLQAENAGLNEELKRLKPESAADIAQEAE